MEEGGKNEQGNVPSSWNYGSFHYNSRLYTSFAKKDTNQSVILKRKHEDLNIKQIPAYQKADYKPKAK